MNKNSLNLIRQQNAFINELNFTDQEIIQNYLKIVDISNNMLDCRKSNSTYCINENNMHEEFYRDKDGKLKIQYSNCPKLLIHKKEWNYLKNYLIRDYDSNLFLSSKTGSNHIKFLNEERHFKKFQNTIVAKLATQIKNNHYFGIYLYGQFNVGKTYIMALFANELSALGMSISYVEAPKIMWFIKKGKSWDERDEHYHQYFQKMWDSDILIIDELGTEKFNNYIHIDMLLPIFQHRLINKMPVYFISNFSLEKLKLNYKRTNRDSVQLDKFINTIENLVENNIIELIGTDLRKNSL